VAASAELALGRYDSSASNILRLLTENPGWSFRVRDGVSGPNAPFWKDFNERLILVSANA
jgi:hypothetical protein